MLATSFAEAAGVAGHQNWGLVFVQQRTGSQVTHQTVVGVRFPSWLHSMEQVGILVSSSSMRDRNEAASSLSFGMSHVLTRMQLRTW